MREEIEYFIKRAEECGNLDDICWNLSKIEHLRLCLLKSDVPREQVKALKGCQIWVSIDINLQVEELLGIVDAISPS